jgi:putative flippase GtrA
MGKLTALRPSDLLRLMRFGAVGLSSTLLYWLLANVFLRLSIRLMTAHCLAYAIAVPINYSMQRGFTFQSSASHGDSLPRFLIISACSFLVSTGIVETATILRLSPAVAITAVIAIVPLLSYLCMSTWVFHHRNSNASSNVGKNTHD